MNKSIRFLLLLFAIAAITTAAFAQRDSLCMRLVDEWFEADSTLFATEVIENVSGQIYILTLNQWLNFSISIEGELDLDTTLLNRSAIEPRLDMANADTIEFIKRRNDLLIYNVSSPSEPESVFTYVDFFPESNAKLLVADSILFVMWADESLLRYNISNPFEISAIPTSASFNYLNTVCFPYAYIISDRVLYYTDLTSDSTLNLNAMGLLPCSYTEENPRNIQVVDSLIFVGFSWGKLKSFKTNFSMDTLIQLDTLYDGFIDEDYNCEMLIHDTLLFVSWGAFLKVINIADPTNLDEIAFYYNPNALYDALLYIDSFLVACATSSVNVLKYPCPDCDGTCELDREMPEYLNFDIYPNPFNANCHISLPEHGDDPYHLAIYDINGQVVHRAKTASKTKSYTWNAAEMPGGIYLINIANDNFKACSKVLLVK